MALTPKKRAFVDALRGGASNKEAAIAAGYAASSASAAGSRLAKDPYVMAAMAGTTFNKKLTKLLKLQQRNNRLPRRRKQPNSKTARASI